MLKSEKKWYIKRHIISNRRRIIVSWAYHHNSQYYNHQKLNRQRLIKLFLYCVIIIQLEVTDSNAVFYEDYKSSVRVRKSWERGDDVDNV